jgi:hypothetical protein
MGNFHCVPSGCARLVYREYLPPVIRYRYPGEDWIYVDGDDFFLEVKKGQCNEGYRISYVAGRLNRGVYSWGSPQTLVTTVGPIDNWRIIHIDNDDYYDSIEDTSDFINDDGIGLGKSTEFKQIRQTVCLM